MPWRFAGKPDGWFRWWEIERHIRARWLLFGAGLRIDLLRPFRQLLQLNLFMPSEVATNSLRKVGQLALVTARIGHQIDH